MLSNCDDIRKAPHSQRFDKMCNKFFDIAELGSELEDKCAIIMDGLDELMERVMKGNSICASTQPTHEESMSTPSLGESLVLSPMAVRSKGRPPFKRKVSRFDEKISKLKGGKPSRPRRRKLYKGEGRSSIPVPEQQIPNGVGTQESLFEVCPPRCWSTSLNDVLHFNNQQQI